MWGPLRHLIGLRTDTANINGNVIQTLRAMTQTLVDSGYNTRIFTASTSNWSPGTGADVTFVTVGGGGGGQARGGVEWVWTPTRPSGSTIRDPYHPHADSEGYYTPPPYPGFWAPTPATAGNQNAGSNGASGATNVFCIRRLNPLHTFSIVVGSGGLAGNTSNTASSVSVNHTPVFPNPRDVRVSSSITGVSRVIPAGFPAQGQHSPANTGLGGAGAASISAPLPPPIQTWVTPNQTSGSRVGTNGGSGIVFAFWRD